MGTEARVRIAPAASSVAPAATIAAAPWAIAAVLAVALAAMVAAAPWAVAAVLAVALAAWAATAVRCRHAGSRLSSLEYCHSALSSVRRLTPAAARELPAGPEVLEPEAHRVRRSGLDPERLERADVDDRIVVGKREIQERRRGRHSDSLELEQRPDPGCLVSRRERPAGGVDDRGLGIRRDLRAAADGLPGAHLDELRARVVPTGPGGRSDRQPRTIVGAGEPAGERRYLLGRELQREGPARGGRQSRPPPNSCRNNRNTLKMSRKMPAAIGTAP